MLDETQFSLFLLLLLDCVHISIFPIGFAKFDWTTSHVFSCVMKNGEYHGNGECHGNGEYHGNGECKKNVRKCVTSTIKGPSINSSHKSVTNVTHHSSLSWLE